MTAQIENNKDSKNQAELAENQVFEKIKNDLNPIQENLSEKKITVDEAKSELKKINEWIQWTKLEIKDKKEIWKAFDHLTKLEQNIDENTLKNEVNEIINLLETLTKKDLSNLKDNIQKNTHQIHEHLNSERPAEVQEWLEEASNNLASTIDNASQDSNVIARTIGSRMKKLIS